MLQSMTKQAANCRGRSSCLNSCAINENVAFSLTETQLLLMVPDGETEVPVVAVSRTFLVFGRRSVKTGIAIIATDETTESGKRHSDSYWDAQWWHHASSRGTR